MAKKMKKFMSMALVLCMMASMLSVGAFAAEEVTTEAVEGGTIVTTTTTNTDENGNTTVTVKIEENTSKTDDDGKNVTFNEVTTETTVTNPDGEEIASSIEISGSETKEWNEDPSQEGPDVTLDLKDGETTTASGSTTPVEETLEDGSTETTTTNRDVTGSLEIDESFEIIADESKLECPVAPEDYEGKGYYDGYQEGENKNYRDGLLSPDSYTEDAFADLVAPKPDEDGYEKGFDMTWTGYGDATDGAVAVWVKDIVWLIDETTGEIAVDEEGNPIIDMEKSTFMNGKNGKQNYDFGEGVGMVSQSVQFALRHENGEFFYAYCMDASTGAGPEGDRWYNIRNLEDAIESEDNPDGYLTAEEAAQIRAIATNGYWGTEDGRGSVESLKELLKATYGVDSKITVRYPGSNTPHVFDIYELIDGLTEHEALAATQAAIWTLANAGDITYDQGSYGGMAYNGSVIGVLSAHKYQNSKGGWLNEYKPAMDGESDARLQALYKCLLSLEPIYADGELREDSTVIPNENVVTDVALEIKDKVADNAANADDNKDNDVFNSDLSFKLAFVPGEKDEMYVVLMDGNNQPILGEDGQPIKKLLASETSAKEGANVIKPVNGVYTLTGLKLSENSPFEFDLRLEGTQYLNEGVYIYQAEGGRRESQTLVGLAKGEQKVVVSNKMTIKFDVDEYDHVVAEREWSNEDTEEAPAPGAFAVVVHRPLENIPEEEVPLADAPQTGDEAIVFAALTLLAGISLMAMHVSEQKRKEEV